MDEGTGRAEECFIRSGTGHERGKVVIKVGRDFTHKFLREAFPSSREGYDVDGG